MLSIRSLLSLLAHALIKYNHFLGGQNKHYVVFATLVVLVFPLIIMASSFLHTHKKIRLSMFDISLVWYGTIYVFIPNTNERTVVPCGSGYKILFSPNNSVSWSSMRFLFCLDKAHWVNFKYVSLHLTRKGQFHHSFASQVLGILLQLWTNLCHLIKIISPNNFDPKCLR